MAEKTISRAQLARMLRMLLELRTRRFPDAGDLAEVCEVSRRTAYRDLEALADAGVPVVYRADHRGYEVGPGFFLDPLRLEEAEVIALVIRAAMPTHVLADAARSGLAKILQSVSGDWKPHCLAMLNALEMPGNLRDSGPLLEILGILAEGQPIEVVRLRGEVEEEMILANGRLRFEDQRWILVGDPPTRDVPEVRIPVAEIVRVGVRGESPVDSRTASIRIASAFETRAHSSVG